MLTAIRSLSNQIIKVPNISSAIFRPISTTHPLQLKEIRENRDGKDLVIEGVYVEHPRAQYMLKSAVESTTQCSVCATGLDIKHTDVMILSQFMRPDGCMLPRRITGLCVKQQKRIGTMVTMAQKAGLMPNLRPANAKKDPERRPLWKKFKMYFDESTIGVKKNKTHKKNF